MNLRSESASSGVSLEAKNRSKKKKVKTQRETLRMWTDLQTCPSEIHLSTRSSGQRQTPEENTHTSKQLLYELLFKRIHEFSWILTFGWFLKGNEEKKKKQNSISWQRFVDTHTHTQTEPHTSKYWWHKQHTVVWHCGSWSDSLF